MEANLGESPKGGGRLHSPRYSEDFIKHRPKFRQCLYVWRVC